MLSLSLVHPQSKEQLTIPLVNRMEIGYNPLCHLQLPLAGISDRHARVQLDQGGWILVDQESIEGTYVNDLACTQTRLRGGDRVRLGIAYEMRIVDSTPLTSAGDQPTWLEGLDAVKKDGRFEGKLLSVVWSEERIAVHIALGDEGEHLEMISAGELASVQCSRSMERVEAGWFERVFLFGRAPSTEVGLLQVELRSHGGRRIRLGARVPTVWLRDLPHLDMRSLRLPADTLTELVQHAMGLGARLAVDKAPAPPTRSDTLSSSALDGTWRSDRFFGELSFKGLDGTWTGASPNRGGTIALTPTGAHSFVGHWRESESRFGALALVLDLDGERATGLVDRDTNATGSSVAAHEGAFVWTLR